ncbi:type I polyketide synthase [Virgisporangium ochraceum]|uniref:Polyketide synthase n=1 Tax=Virgisporangium ochraceum TaxID=65505 RepID=A0A8J3ZV61_9ACTN|nr:type I polyketide synthase [Virgisporangium ochraceum]GIJ70772.1 polyketide synthase [Virgisporangium ochraceum]
MNRIAIVGMDCRYPDAASPGDLWENVLAGRRAFRRIPTQRLRLADYFAADPAVADRFYAQYAALIEGYRFDRVAYRIAGSTYRSTDLTHWLALDVAAGALADAGFPGGDGLPRERTAVVVGNTLTGEFTRANVMRLRWPYVRRVVAAALERQGWDAEHLTGFLRELERDYKSPFPAVDEDTLAGGLSNTIAGRICNHFDLNGGGHTVDGACASSLLSVLTACRYLTDGTADVVVAGGVDLSIDPFELVGFAKTGALAAREMRVYDRGSHGFWPGEGCGMVVLMRADDAHRAGQRVYATIAGWGMSSDGRGGITRPEADGYRLALHRAYARAGVGVDTVGYFEGHGTGTEVGDATELRALGAARRDADPDAPAAAIGSVKAVIGHTKAAAGVAGLIKATLAVHHRVLPPTTGCVDPHAELTGERPALRTPLLAEPWPHDVAVRAGVTAMGFGGINTHLVLDGADDRTEAAGGGPDPRVTASAAHDAELLLFDADGPDELRGRLVATATLAATVSYAQLGDLAAALQRDLRDRPYRAAAVVRSPDDAHRALTDLVTALDEGRHGMVDRTGRAFVGHAARPARIGFLFPGQGSGRGGGRGALHRRFAVADEVLRRAEVTGADGSVDTAVAQPRIAAGSLAGLRVLDLLGVRADVAVGHSLGEIVALCWAGAIDDDGLPEVAAARGRLMSAHGLPGTMAGVAADPVATVRMIGAEPVVVAGYNGPRQTVVAGPKAAVDRVCQAAAAAGIESARLPVSHAFHSPLMAPAADRFAGWLAGRSFAPLRGRIVSTVTGSHLPAGVDVADLLNRQVVEPVRFAEAVTAAAAEVDLFVEVGPGHVLTRMARDLVDVPVVATETDSRSLGGFLAALGAAHVAGAALDHRAFAAGRFSRPLALDATFSFFENPCESAPAVAAAVPAVVDSASEGTDVSTAGQPDDAPVSTLERLRTLAAERAELPVEVIHDDSQLLDDLHLSSITVGQLVNQAARDLGLPAMQAPTNFATATVRQLAEALDELAATGGPVAAPGVDGVGPWVRPFEVHLAAAPRPPSTQVVTTAASGATSATSATTAPWRLFAGPDPLATDLRAALDRAGLGPGVLICVPADCGPADLELALDGVKAATSLPAGGRLVVLQRGRGAAAMARTARLEAPTLRTTIVDAPLEPSTVDLVVADVAATDGFSETHYDLDGIRRVPQLRMRPMRAGRPPLDPSDVLLVTGGGKGITAECALDLAARTGARLAVLGRSDPATDAALSANLDRMRAAGVPTLYARADVTDPAAVRTAVAAVEAEFGRVTAVLHGAGRNEPASLSTLDAQTLRRTLAPKIDGLRAVLDAVDLDSLRLLVTFGSIIGRAGLHGEAHYATANDWLADLTRQVAGDRPGCRAVCLEWSVWSGVGMGERLSVVETLQGIGVTPITPEQGVAVLRDILDQADLPPALVVTGRVDHVDTVRFERPELPLLRFVERELVRYHGVELVTEVELTPVKDPYLDEHRLDGNLLFPAVFGLEAMAQVATSLGDHAGVPTVENAEFLRPIVVPSGGATTVRIAALAVDADTVDVSIRSSETAFAAEHFRARLSFRPWDPPAGPPATDLPPIGLDPGRDLYDGTLFQGRRFQRVHRYRRMAARAVEAEVRTADDTWFSAFLPGRLLLGDPGARDAFMHGIQVCVPDATLLPIGVTRIHPAGPKLAGALDGVTLVAVERSHDGDTFVYDLAVRDASGTVVEFWEGLRLRAVRRTDGAGPWVPALLGPHLQRRLGDVLDVDPAVVVEARDGRDGTAAALSRAVGRPVEVRYRPDGRPEVDGVTVSAAHLPSLTLAVAGTGTLACDLETVRHRSAADWAGLLGPHAALVGHLRKPPDDAATTVWCAVECLRKAGSPPGAPLTLLTIRDDGWTVLASGPLRVAAWTTTIRDIDAPVVVAVLVKEERS